MEMLLRGIRKSKWYKNPDVPWLPENELQADALGDITTSSNALSVWLIEEDGSNIENVVSALASNRDELTNFDYAVLELDEVINSGINIKEATGETPDDNANGRWHRILVELTVPNINTLAITIQTSGQIKRVSPKNVKKWIREGLESGRIDPSRIEDKILHKVRADA